jgi:hypothetical protein
LDFFLLQQIRAEHDRFGKNKDSTTYAIQDVERKMQEERSAILEDLESFNNVTLKTKIAFDQQAGSTTD